MKTKDTRMLTLTPDEATAIILKHLELPATARVNFHCGYVYINGDPEPFHKLKEVEITVVTYEAETKP